MVRASLVLKPGYSTTDIFFTQHRDQYNPPDVTALPTLQPSRRYSPPDMPAMFWLSTLLIRKYAQTTGLHATPA